MKKLLISMAILLLAIFLVPSKAYAYYESDTTTDLLYTYTYQTSIQNVTVDDVTADYYRYLITFPGGPITSDITAYFSSSLSGPNGIKYWQFSKVSSVNNNSLTKAVSDGTYSDNSTTSFYVHDSSTVYLHMYVGLPTQNDVENILFSKLRIAKLSAFEFFNFKLANNIDYQTGYWDGYNNGTSSLENALIDEYQAGYSAGLVAEEEAKLSIINFVPQMLGSVWGFIYTIIIWEVPFINISLLDIFLIVGAISLIIILVKLVI